MCVCMCACVCVASGPTVFTRDSSVILRYCKELEM